jgi:hypothetical protein
VSKPTAHECARAHAAAPSDNTTFVKLAQPPRGYDAGQSGGSHFS